MMSLTSDEEEAVPFTYDELSGYTKAELLEIATQNDVEGLSMTNTKDEIINTILEAVN